MMRGTYEMSGSKGDGIDTSKTNIINGRCRLEHQIGSGSFGEIYVGHDIHKNIKVAVKLENISCKYPQLHIESRFYKAMKRQIGIPKLYWYGRWGKYNVMVFELLGVSLEDLFNYCLRIFTAKTVVQLACQLLFRLQVIHDHGFIHRDLKPDNFLMGPDGKGHVVYIIDFGLSKRIIGENKKHIPYREGKHLTGTARYASISTHQGIEQSRRDDLESLGYVFVYFLKGRLPWQGLFASNKKQKYEKIMEKKLTTPLKELCSDIPRQFYLYLKYCRNLKFDEKPDYDKLRFNLLSVARDVKMIYNSYYDWNDIKIKAALSDSACKESWEDAFMKEIKFDHRKPKLTSQPTYTFLPAYLNSVIQQNKPEILIDALITINQLDPHFCTETLVKRIGWVILDFLVIHSKSNKHRPHWFTRFVQKTDHRYVITQWEQTIFETVPYDYNFLAWVKEFSPPPLKFSDQIEAMKSKINAIEESNVIHYKGDLFPYVNFENRLSFRDNPTLWKAHFNRNFGSPENEPKDIMSLVDDRAGKIINPDFLKEPEDAASFRPSVIVPPNKSLPPNKNSVFEEKPVQTESSCQNNSIPDIGSKGDKYDYRYSCRADSLESYSEPDKRGPITRVNNCIISDLSRMLINDISESSF